MADDALAAEFESNRVHLHAVANRILGSDAEADDAVQEAWLRLSRADVGGIENLGGWLTTVTARICLDKLRVRKVRREEPDAELATDAAVADPEYEALLADSVGAALAVVLDTLSPPERVAFVLHDVFAVPFDEIAVVLGRSPSASKQLASRARGRLRGVEPEPASELPQQREVVDAFLTASRSGDLAGLVAVLAPDVVMRADAAAVRMGAADLVQGAGDVAGVFSGRALEAQPAVIDGNAGVVWAPNGSPRVVWELEMVDGTITRIDMLAAPETLGELALVLD